MPRMKPNLRPFWCLVLIGACGLPALAQAPRVAGATPAPHNPAAIDWQPLDGFQVARTETTVGQFRRFVEATTRTTLAERQGGGQVYEAAWVQKPGWTWRTPFGGRVAAADREPAVHITFDEAQAFCRWAGGALPTDAQWVAAAYTEQRAAPPAPWQRGKTYTYPTGDSPSGAQCLEDCGPAAQSRALRHGARLLRGDGHALTGTTPAGVNGLHDMGANVWEWVAEPSDAAAHAAEKKTPTVGQRLTRGGSWWYGAGPMRADHLQSKPVETAVVYIGFRCVRPDRSGPGS